MMTDVFIVRHGNTFDKGDIVTRVGARTDLPLSISGQAQAADLAAHFAEICPEGFRAAYCSSLRRTAETAEAILKQSAHAPQVEVLEFLTEIDYGPDENQPEEKVVARLGEAVLKAWDEDAIPPPDWHVKPAELVEAWSKLFEDLKQLQIDPRPVLIVTSNGIARFALPALGKTAVQVESIKLKTGAYGHIRLSEDGADLVAWNIRP